MKSVLLLDSNKEFLEKVSEMLSQLGDIVITQKSKSNSIESQLSKKVFDLLIVNLSSKFDMIEILNKFQLDSPILFYADNYETSVYNKIKKFNFKAFLPMPFNIHAIKSITEAQLCKSDNSIEDDIFYYRKKGKLIPIPKREIEYINTDGNYCILHLNNAIHTIRYPLAKLIEDFNYPMLKRAHRQFAVNILRVSQFDISNNECFISGNSIPVGRAYKKHLKQSLAGSVSAN